MPTRAALLALKLYFLPRRAISSAAATPIAIRGSVAGSGTVGVGAKAENAAAIRAIQERSARMIYLLILK
jgi:hypothetical protein